jgi:hypothetical protein
VWRFYQIYAKENVCFSYFLFYFSNIRDKYTLVQGEYINTLFIFNLRLVYSSLYFHLSFTMHQRKKQRELSPSSKSKQLQVPNWRADCPKQSRDSSEEPGTSSKRTKEKQAEYDKSLSDALTTQMELHFECKINDCIKDKKDLKKLKPAFLKATS